MNAIKSQDTTPEWVLLAIPLAGCIVGAILALVIR